MTADRFVIEPFDPAKHDWTAISCEIEQVDNYFQKTANKLAQVANVRPFVVTTPEGAIVGFDSINVQAVHYSELPSKYAHTRPSHANIPAAYISMIGRDQRYKGQKHGSSLLIDALSRIAQTAEAVGIAIIMVDVLDCGDAGRVERGRSLYQEFGLTPLRS